MPFKTDAGGVAVRLNDAKLYVSASASTWNTRLSQIGNISGKVIICTYSLPDIDYIQKILDKRSENVTIIAHEKFRKKAMQLKAIYPSLKIYLKSDVHAKIVLVEPQTVWLSSANFGSSGWFEQTIGIHSRTAYDFYLNALSKYLKVAL